MAKFVKGYWDCAFCGKTGIGGDLRACPGCGRPRGDDVTFYVKDAEALSKEEEARAAVGPDWYCPYCNSLNSAADTACRSCGAPREDSKQNYFDVQQAKAAREERAQQELESVAPQKPKKKKRKLLPLILIGAALLIVLIAVLGSLPRSSAMTVDGFAWRRTIEIEENTFCEEHDWSLPAGAELVQTRREIHHYDRILDHYETHYETRTREVLDGYDIQTEYVDQGNGYFETVEYEVPRYVTETYEEAVEEPVYREEPVYETMYYYTIWRWLPVRTVDALDVGHEAVWPGFELAENEREGLHYEEYTVTLADKKGRTTTYALSEDGWMQLDKGQRVTVYAKGGALELRDADGTTIAALTKK